MKTVALLLLFTPLLAVAQPVEVQEFIYDDGTVPFIDSNTLFAILLGQNGQHANRFDPPGGSTLLSVSVAPYYDHDAGNTTLPPNAPRDFRLHIWADDGMGFPGEEIFSLEVDDNRDNANDGTLFFLNIDLSDFDDTLANLPTPIYVGLSNKGTDENYLVAGVTEFEGDNNPSVLFQLSFAPPDGGWDSFSNLVINQTLPLENRVLPIRASFLVPVSTNVNATEEVPERTALYQNYPNPFNAATTVQFMLAQSTWLTLKVYDMHGREMATLAEGYFSAGSHVARWDAVGLASGIYIYRLETEAYGETKKMILAK